MPLTPRAVAQRIKRVLTPEQRRSAAYHSPSFCGTEIQKSAGYVYALIHAGKLRAVRVNGFIRVRREDWQAWLARNVRPFVPGEDAE